MRKIDLTNFQVATSETARQINRRITLNLIRHQQDGCRCIMRARESYRPIRPHSRGFAEL